MIALENSRILIVGPSWIGDMVMSQALLKLLNERYPSSKLTVLAPAWSRALLDRMPEVESSIESPFNHGELKLLQRWKFAKDLKGKFDCAIILPNSFKSALIPFFAKIPDRIGWRGEFRNLLLTDCRMLDPLKYPLMVQRFLALGLVASQKTPPEFPEPELKIDNKLARKTAEAYGLEPQARIMVICPGAEYGDAKQWPAGHFAVLCSLAVQDGWQVWIIGSNKDHQVASDIVAGLDPQVAQSISDITGKTSLSQAIDLISLASAVVTNDSGLMHIAASVGRPILALYGSTSPDFTPPLAERVKSLTTEIDCRPCFERTCPLGHKRCLTEISAESVFNEVGKLTALNTALEH